MNTLEIVSNGTAFGTTVSLENGPMLHGVVSIEIHRIEPGDTVRATIVFDRVALKLNCQEIEFQVIDRLAVLAPPDNAS